MTTETNEDIYYPEMAFLMNESLSDVVFVVNGQRIPALKQLLIVKSRVFRAMFSGNFGETQESNKSKLPEIVVKDTTSDAFKTLIRFIYTEVLIFKDSNDLQHICEVYQLSDRYEVLRLRDIVCSHLKSKINSINLLWISKLVFRFNIEELMTSVMTFIKTNINELIRKDVYYLKLLNDLTNDKLFDVLTEDRREYNIELIYCIIGGKCISVKREMLLNKNVLDEIRKQFPIFKYPKYPYNSRSIDAFKTFVGYLYFDKLILKDEDDIQLIRELCRITKKIINYKPFEDCVCAHLQKRITVENLKSISGIAFDNEFDSLIEKVNEFIKENFAKIVNKSDTHLRRINYTTDGYLLEVFAEFTRKVLRK